jgi:hypothetical protein
MKSLGQEYLGDQTARWRLGEHPCAFRRALCSALTGWPATWAAWYDFAVAQRKTIRSPRRDAIYGLQFRPIVKIKEFAMPETLPFICMLTISILSNLITYLILTTSACISHSPSDSEWKYGRLVVITAGVLFAAARSGDLLGHRSSVETCSATADQRGALLLLGCLFGGQPLASVRSQCESKSEGLFGNNT